MRHKNILITALASLVLLPSALAAGMLDPLTKVLGTFTRFIFIDIKGVVGEETFIRVLLWLLMFTAFYAILMNLGKTSPFKKKNFAMPIAMVLAFISAIFMPKEYVFLLAHTYGFVSSFLLLAVPVVAIIMLNHFVFPTTETKEPDVGKRRINNAAKGVLYYFLAMLITNYSGAITSAKPTGFNDVYSFTIAICMFLFIYHIIVAIFSTGPYKKGEEEGWFEGMLKGEKKEEGGPSTPPVENGGKDKGKETDLGPIRTEIARLGSAIADFKKDALDLAASISSLEEDDIISIVTGLSKKTDSIKSIGIRISLMDEFKKLGAKEIGELRTIMSTYSDSTQRIIQALGGVVI